LWIGVNAVEKLRWPVMSTKQPNPPPHNIPAGIDPKWIYLKSFTGHADILIIYDRDPRIRGANKNSAIFRMPIEVFSGYPLSNYPPENSLHRRVIENGVPTDRWEWVPND
jgi:hypothetical protein